MVLCLWSFTLERFWLSSRGIIRWRGCTCRRPRHLEPLHDTQESSFRYPTEHSHLSRVFSCQKAAAIDFISTPPLPLQMSSFSAETDAKIPYTSAILPPLVFLSSHDVMKRKVNGVYILRELCCSYDMEERGRVGVWKGKGRFPRISLLNASERFPNPLPYRACCFIKCIEPKLHHLDGVGRA